MKRVFEVGPDRNLKGGISTIIRNISESQKINENYLIETIATISDTKLITFIKSIFKIKKAENSDIIHFHVASNGSFIRKYILYKVVAKQTKKIFHLHGGNFINFYRDSNIMLKYFIKDMLKGCDLVINVSDFMLNDMKKEFPYLKDKLVRIYNGINKSENVISYKEKDKSIVFMGKLVKYKGIYDFLSVLEELRELFIKMEWNVYIAGDGEVEKVENIVNKRGLSSFVNVVGWVDKEEKENILNMCKIMVMPSHIESFGISVIEAMSYGISIVCTDVGALPEIIKNKTNGFVVKQGDIGELGRCIKQLVNDDKLMQKIYYTNIDYSKKFTIDEMINCLINQYNIL